MLRSFCFVLFVCFVSQHSVGQNRYKLFEEEKPVLMKHEFSGGVTLHSSGWGLDFRRGRNVTGYLKRMYEIELTGLKHEKEIKSVNPFFENAKSYVYGKMNTLTVLRLGYGFQKIITGKGDRGGVELRLNYMGGFGAGLVKPVYLDILYPTNVLPFEFEVVTERYDPGLHFVDNIYGRSGITRGLDEIKFYPGIYSKLGLSYEVGNEWDRIFSIETGILLDAFLDKIPIMALTDNKQFYPNFYITILFGKKW
jgi:hypothetical protein